MTRNATARLGLAALLATVLLTLANSAAWAHEDEDKERAFNLIRQAIALIVNTPGNHHAIEDKIDDALKAEDTSDVQLPLVQQAMDALEADDVHQARRLLEQSIGARVHTSNADPVPIGDHPPLAGAETGTLATVEGMPGRHGLTGGDWVMLVVSLAVGLGGIAWAFRLRPHFPHLKPREVTP
jgi:hypothetical protein